MPSVFTAQLCESPAATMLKLPAGGVACPERFLPQQAIVLSGFRPQVWDSPAETEVKMPPGEVACPEEFLPQQVTVPSALTPQLWEPPADTELKVWKAVITRAGGDKVPSSFR